MLSKYFCEWLWEIDIEFTEVFLELLKPGGSAVKLFPRWFCQIYTKFFELFLKWSKPWKLLSKYLCKWLCWKELEIFRIIKTWGKYCSNIFPMGRVLVSDFWSSRKVLTWIISCYFFYRYPVQYQVECNIFKIIKTWQDWFWQVHFNI